MIEEPNYGILLSHWHFQQKIPSTSNTCWTKHIKNICFYTYAWQKYYKDYYYKMPPQACVHMNWEDYMKQEQKDSKDMKHNVS